MSKIIELSTRNFERASILKGNDEFCFVIGKQQVMCHLFVAGFLSQNVSRMIISDPTINKFVFTSIPNNENQEYEEKIITLLQKLIRGEKITILQEEIEKINVEIETISQSFNSSEYTKTLIYHYLTFIEQLGNEELKQQFYSFLFSYHIQSTNDTTTQAKSEIESQLKKFLNIEKVLFLVQNKFCQKENAISLSKEYLNKEYSNFIDEIAEHFYEIDESLLIQLNSFILNDILSSSKLKIKDEDALLETLLSRRSSILQHRQNNDDKFFIEKVQFEFLSEKGIQSFLSEIDFHSLSQDIWSSISKRLVLPVTNKDDNKRAVIKPTMFAYDFENPFKGILNHLSEKSNGNIHSNQTIEITSSHACCGSIKTLVDFKDQASGFHISNNIKPYWLKYDFMSKRIQINSYFIKVRDYSSRTRYLKSWSAEISEDGENWEKIDEQNNVSELNGKNNAKVFNVNMTKPFRYFRIISNKENHYDSNGFALGNLELYGKIID